MNLPPDQPKATRSIPATPGAPPWLWLWVALFLIGLPNMLALWQSSLDQIAQIRDGAATLQAISGDPSAGRLHVLLYPAVLLDVLPLTALLAGVAASLLPTVRGQYVQRRYRTAPLPIDDSRLGPVLREIATFVQAEAPGLALTWCKRLDVGEPFVYPLGYRRVALALTPRFLLRWRQNRATAEAALLHEIGHYARGDGLLIGVGSLFECVTRYAIPAFVLFFFLPVLIIFLDQQLTSSTEVAELGMALADNVAFQLSMGSMQLSSALAALLSYGFWFASALVAPLAAIWAAEFGADRYAADRQGTDQHVNALLAASSAKSHWRWLLDHLSHPPARLRIWMLQRRLPVALALLALILPLAYLARMLYLEGYAATGMLAAHIPPDDIRLSSEISLLWYLFTSPRFLLPMAIVLALWPVIVPGWERLMTGARSSSARSHAAVYWACAALLLLLAAGGHALGDTLTAKEASRAEAEAKAASNIPADAFSTPSATPIAAPSAPAGSGVSRANPIPFGAAAASDALAIAIMEVVRGDEASALLQEVNMLADAPPAGQEYVLVHVQARNDSATPQDLAMFQFVLEDATGDRVVTSETTIPPEPWLFLTIAPGTTADGWMPFSVDVPAEDQQVIYLGDMASGMGPESWQYFALEE